MADMANAVSVDGAVTAEIGKGSPFVRVLGQAGATALFSKLAGVIAHQERVIARFNPELSF